ncbi:tRNA (adenosine(37)-N6)-threonylcarbamoyltransferase complex ATPase subunit type 1 TsaE [Clostridia bacterium]|nr:tRNA (adenosine(37)-N6)-threonylcarbamoyltransferase complex ATPase subunit type 1 TsaE [Clostridia bacterium]
MIFETWSEEETIALGIRLGTQAETGGVYTIDGELGAGKTMLTQGIAKGLSVMEVVNSPTFTIVKVYETGRMPLYHFDVYRIADVEEMEEIGYEDYFYGDGLSLIEWSSRIRSILPENRTEIQIEKDIEKGFDYRRICIIQRIAV